MSSFLEFTFIFIDFAIHILSSLDLSVDKEVVRKAPPLSMPEISRCSQPHATSYDASTSTSLAAEAFPARAIVEKPLSLTILPHR